MLLRLARSEVAAPVGKTAPHVNDPWLAAFAHWGLPAPRGNPLKLSGRDLRFVWPDHLVAADIGPFAADIAEAAALVGYTVVELPEQPPSAPPADLAALLGATA